MARVHDVKKAQKAQGDCVKCHKPIPAGSPYQWVKASRFSPKYKKHTPCPPFTAVEMESNEKKGMCYQAQQDLQNAINGLGTWPKDDKTRPDVDRAKEFKDDLEQAFDEAIGQVEEAVGMWEESYDNLPEGFQQGDSGQQMEELKDQAQSYQDELESVKDSLEDWDPEEDKLEDWIYRLKEEADNAAGALEF